MGKRHKKPFKLFGVEIQKSYNPHDGRNQIFIRWKPHEGIKGGTYSPPGQIAHIPNLKPPEKKK